MNPLSGTLTASFLLKPPLHQITVLYVYVSRLKIRPCFLHEETSTLTGYLITCACALNVADPMQTRMFSQLIIRITRKFITNEMLLKSTFYRQLNHCLRFGNKFIALPMKSYTNCLFYVLKRLCRIFCVQSNTLFYVQKYCCSINSQVYCTIACSKQEHNFHFLYKILCPYYYQLL